VTERIEVQIEGKYDGTAAKKALDDAKKIETADPELDISADDTEAKRSVADLLRDVDKLDSETATVTLAMAAADVQRQLTDILVDIAKVDASDIDIDAKVSQANAVKADLDAIETKLKQVGEKAEDTERKLDRTTGGGGGSNLRGNAIADLTGPLGEASGAASDFAGVFDGLGDIVSETALKMGASTATAGRIASAMGVAGVAVAAGAALWTVWSAKADKAAQRAEELATAQEKINTALAKGDTLSAAAELVDKYGAAFSEASQLVGASAADVTRYITGQTDVLRGLTDANGNVIESMKFMSPEILKARQAYIDANGALDANNTLVQQVAVGMGGLATATDTSTDATNTNADAMERSAEKSRDLAAAIQEQIDAAISAADANIAASEAQEAVAEATQATIDVQKEEKSTLEDLETAVDNERDAVINAAKANQRLADEMASATGNTLTATQKIDNFNASLIDNARNATPAAQQAVFDYLIQVNQIPADKATDIKAILDQFGLDAAKIALDETSATREAAIVADAQNVAATEIELDNLARQRFADIVARVNNIFGGSASSSGNRPAGTTAAAPSMVTNNITLPAGSRGVDVLRTVTGQSRRSGTRYGAAVTSRARR
jgi:hypothetical protein